MHCKTTPVNGRDSGKSEDDQHHRDWWQYLKEERCDHKLDEVDLGDGEGGGAAVHEGGHWEALRGFQIALLEELIQHPLRPPAQ